MVGRTIRLSQHKNLGLPVKKRIRINSNFSFNEAEITADTEVEEPTLETITYKRKKSVGQRDAKLENLPTETIHYRLAEEEQVCLCCGGTVHEIVRKYEEIKIIPAQVKVVEHVQHIYSCRQCEREGIETPIVTAKMPTPIYPKVWHLHRLWPIS